MTGVGEEFGLREYSTLEIHTRVVISGHGSKYTYFPCPDCGSSLTVEHRFVDEVFAVNCDCGWSGDVRLFEEPPNLSVYSPNS